MFRFGSIPEGTTATAAAAAVPQDAAAEAIGGAVGKINDELQTARSRAAANSTQTSRPLHTSSEGVTLAGQHGGAMTSHGFAPHYDREPSVSAWQRLAKYV